MNFLTHEEIEAELLNSNGPELEHMLDAWDFSDAVAIGRGFFNELGLDVQESSLMDVVSEMRDRAR